MVYDNSKRLCTECEWLGDSGELDYVQDPKRDDNGWWICPKCRSADTLLMVCDEPLCNLAATCGTPTKDGYRSVCGKHYQKIYASERITP